MKKSNLVKARKMHLKLPGEITLRKFLLGAGEEKNIRAKAIGKIK